MRPTAYLYARWSTSIQSDGDSFRRQLEFAEEYCRRKNLHLDNTLDLVDRGLTGFDRPNFEIYALTRFIEECQIGKIKKGSYLIVENVDRISREKPMKGFKLISSIIELGINIVQMKPEIVLTDESDLMPMLSVIFELTRGNSESQAKSMRLKALWGERKKQASKDNPTNLNMPKWLKLENGKITTIPDRVDTVKKIYNLAIAGHGAYLIAKKLNESKIPCWRRKHKLATHSNVWSETSVRHILNNPAVHGEYTTKTMIKKRPIHTDNDRVIPDYYPQIISYTDYLKARDAIKNRTRCGGKRGKHINLFSNLLFDVNSGVRLYTRHFVSSKQPPIICPTKKLVGAKWISFPAIQFEKAVTNYLHEIKLSDILPTTRTDNELETISKEYNTKENLYKKLKEKSEESVEAFEAYSDRVIAMRQELKILNDRIEKKKQENANPLSSNWGEIKTIPLETEDDRLRYQAVLRKIVSRIDCNFRGNSKKRQAEVRIHFHGSDKHRTIVIDYTCPVRGGHGGEMDVYTWKTETKDNKMDFK